MILGGYYVLTGNVIGGGVDFDGGKLSTYFGYFDTLIWPMLAISMLIDNISRSRASYNRIAELLKTEPSVKDNLADLRKDLPVFKGALEFKNLDFSYEDDENQKVLQGISLKINAGENIGIVGRTGSGKTTFVNSILKIHNIPKIRYLSMV